MAIGHPAIFFFVEVVEKIRFALDTAELSWLRCLELSLETLDRRATIIVLHSG